MTPKGLARLLGVTAAAVLAAGASVWIASPGPADASRGEVFFPGLAARANDLTALRIDAGDWQADIVRTDAGFADASGYPVDAQAIRALFTAMATLTIEEAKTTDPLRYADLELAEPDAANGAGRRIAFLAGSDTAAGLVLGKRDMSVGGTSGGVYARRSDEPQAWLLRGALDLPPDRAAWFDTALLALPAERLRAVTLQGAEGIAPIVFSTSAGAGQAPAAQASSAPLPSGANGVLAPVSGLPADRPVDTARVSRLASLLQDLRFRDVRKASAPATRVASATFETQDGAQITLERLAPEGNGDNAGNWVRVRVAPGSDDAQAGPIGQLVQKTTGFDFLLAASTLDLLAPDASSWLQPDPANPS